MAINIKSPEVVAQIRRLAKERDIDLTQAVSLAVRHELDRSAMRQSARLHRMRTIADRVTSLPVRDARTADEILGYDHRGLPT